MDQHTAQEAERLEADDSDHGASLAHSGPALLERPMPGHVALLSAGRQRYFVGIFAGFDSVPEIDEFARGSELAVARLVASSKRRHAISDHRGLAGRGRLTNAMKLPEPTTQGN